MSPQLPRHEPVPPQHDLPHPEGCQQIASSLPLPSLELRAPCPTRPLWQRLPWHRAPILASGGGVPASRDSSLSASPIQRAVCQPPRRLSWRLPIALRHRPDRRQDLRLPVPAPGAFAQSPGWRCLSPVGPTMLANQPAPLLPPRRSTFHSRVLSFLDSRFKATFSSNNLTFSSSPATVMRRDTARFLDSK